MIYTVAALVSAFTTPSLMVAQGRQPSVIMSDTSWRRSYNGRGADVTPNPTPSLSPAPTVPALEQVVSTTSTMTVGQACVFMADGSASTADKKAFLASKGVSDFVIAQAECVAPEKNVQGHPGEAPAAAGADSTLTVGQACVFMADESASTADKKAFLASKGVSDFVIAQAECVAPEKNVQGHPGEAPAAAGAESTLTVGQACVFMADESASTADKKAFLASKGVSDFVIAQAECVAPENNVLRAEGVAGVVVPVGDAATAEARMAAELYKMAPAEAADHLAKNRQMLVAAGVKAEDLDEAQKVIEEAMAVAK